MASLADYFAKERYCAKYEFGTRVFGRWNKIPFIGTIYGDSVINNEQGPRLTIHLDLPIKFANTVYSIIIDTHTSFKGLNVLVDPEDKNSSISRKIKDSKNKPVEKRRSAIILENLKKITK
jgi:hypothetical protein